ncbi:MAG: helicase-related protein, partial [Phycisphaeraceae bacterium]
SRAFMKEDAEKVTTVSGSLTVAMVDQKYLPVEPWDKKQLLLHMLKHEEPETTLVFCRTKATVHKLTSYLRGKDVAVREIHGDLHQKKRTSVMESMRKGKVDVLIASDLAARGLDVEHITHVINYDLPDDPEVYIHRIGRTARAGRKGTAWSYVTPEQGQLLTEIEKLTGTLIEKLEYPSFKPGPVPRDIQAEREREAASEPGEPEDLGQRLSKRALPPELEGLSEEELNAMFPGGKIPRNLPKRTLGSRLRSKRGR